MRWVRVQILRGLLTLRVNQPRMRVDMDAPRQIRVNVSGTYQFTAKVHQDEPLQNVADRAREAMRLGDNLVAHISPGQINFIPKAWS